MKGQKSKHKHQYDRIIIVVYTLQHGTVLSRAYNCCSTCGKIGSATCNFIENGKILALEDLMRKFPAAEIYRINVKHAGFKPKNIEDLKNF